MTKNGSDKSEDHLIWIHLIQGYNDVAAVK